MSNELGYRHFEEGGVVKHYSQDTYAQIDRAINEIIKEAQIRAKALVREKKGEIEKLSQALLEKETLDLNEIVKVLGERPFEVSENFREYLKVKNSM